MFCLWMFGVGQTGLGRQHSANGNVDIVEVPLSFNIGLNDHIELWVKSTGYRGVKVNTPTNLSSFYLPNSQLNFGGFLGSGPAIILAPNNLPAGCASLTGTAVFRPAFSQPFVQYPFIGGAASRLSLAISGG